MVWSITLAGLAIAAALACAVGLDDRQREARGWATELFLVSSVVAALNWWLVAAALAGCGAAMALWAHSSKNRWRRRTPGAT